MRFEQSPDIRSVRWCSGIHPRHWRLGSAGEGLYAKEDFREDEARRAEAEEKTFINRANAAGGR